MKNLYLCEMESLLKRLKRLQEAYGWLAIVNADDEASRVGWNPLVLSPRGYCTRYRGSRPRRSHERHQHPLSGTGQAGLLSTARTRYGTFVSVPLRLVCGSRERRLARGMWATAGIRCCRTVRRTARWSTFRACDWHAVKATWELSQERRRLAGRTPSG